MMPASVEDFLAQKSIAVAGVSRTKRNEAANAIYRKLRSTGYDVFPVNPNAETIEGDRCFPDVGSISQTVDGIVIVTRPVVTEEIVRQCLGAGVPRVWMHRSFGKGSVSEAAVGLCRENDIRVIPGGCPMMFCPPVDIGHRCMRWMLGLFGRLPR